ncbi:glycerophosphodiester phosphodiesterase family protein [Clostridium sp. 1001283B150225_161107_B6]|jgi:glycerophosphoryl diester phosphodiesterase|uniref:glycerophosphodiester phosphodiesterase n=2 Tax=Clostridia TaxID=186801 RepID=UPI00189FC208|nr:glycerophosphodiester phosphodiesterase family protein [Clostridium sp. 1001283B150225_161107_B6]
MGGRNIDMIWSVDMIRSMVKINKRKITAALLGAAVIASMMPARGLAKERSGDGWMSKVEITAHRGDNSQAPENTMPAFKAAVENGADWIELDVTQTKDGVLVIFHDADLMRMTGKADKIWDLSYEELSCINAASHWGPFFKDVRIPTLEEVLDYCKDKIKLNIEVKVNGHQTQDFIPVLVGMIQAKGMAGQCMITSFDYQSLQTVKQLDPGLETGFISSKAIEQPEAFTSADNFVLSIDLINPETVSYIHALGKEVIAWTVNDAYSVDKCRRAGADNLITDKPKKIMED